MATFIPQVTDQFPQESLYTPDYNFLMMGYGQKQAQYDRGFSAVKNMYNSLLSGPLTNSQNKEHRAKVFKAIESQIKSISGLDLSNPGTASKALNTFDPLTNDMDLMYDMQVTASIGKEMNLAEQQRTSTDAKIRANYNPLSVEDLNYTLEDLSESRRGDGSIQQVRPKKYINYVDIMGHLDKLANEQDLKIVESRTQGGYILTSTNGEGAIPAFTDWAAAHLKDPIMQEQIQLMGRVNARRDINNMIQNFGIGRQDAKMLAAQNIAGSMLEQKLEDYQVYKKQTDRLDLSLAAFKKKYHASGLTPEEVETLEQVKLQKNQYQEYIRGIEQEISEIEQGDLSYIANNLDGIYAEQAFKRIANDFGRKRAMSKRGQEIKPDDVVLTKWNIEQKILDRISAERRFQIGEDNKLRMHREKLIQDRELADLENETNIDVIGINTPRDQYSAVDLIVKGYEKNFDESFDLAFSRSGLMGSIPGLSQTKYFPTISKLNSISKGSPVEITDVDINNIRELSEKFDISYNEPKTPEVARAMIRDLMVGLYKYSPEAISANLTDTKGQTAFEITEKASALLGAMQSSVEYLSSAEKELEEISKFISKPDGSLKEHYEAAELIGYSETGIPLYDISKVEKAYREEASKLLPEDVRARSVLSSRIYQSEVTGNQLKSIMMGGIGSRAIINGDDVTEDYISQSGDQTMETLQSLPPEQLQELLGGSTTLTHDPVTETTSFKFNVNPNAAAAKQLSHLKGGEYSIQIDVPMSSLRNADVLEPFQESAMENLPKHYGLGATSILYENPNSTVSIGDHFINSGIDVKLQGQMSNGSYQVVMEGTIASPDGGVVEIEKIIDVERDEYGRPDIERLKQIEESLYRMAHNVQLNTARYKKPQNTSGNINKGLTFD